MAKLHLFNPSHDEALAAGSPYYYPARAARTLARDLSTLPAVWAAGGDFVLLPDDMPVPETATPVFMRESELTAALWSIVDGIEPWGWDTLVAHRLSLLGAPGHLLPTDGELEATRRLSSRLTAVRLLPLLRTDVPETVGESHWCTSETDVWQFVGHCGEAMLKAPWSGSGRGVFRVSGSAPAGNDESRRGRVLRILREQGAVEAEPFYNREADLAMEFRMTRDGNATYEGLSLFATTSTGGYAGNIVASEASLTALLSPEVLPVVEAVRTALLRRLPEVLAGGYEGLLGVDMMLVRHTDGSLRLHPCVEINLRRTMGAVAVDLRRRLPAPTAHALYALHPVTAISREAINLTPGAQTIAATLAPAVGSELFPHFTL